MRELMRVLGHPRDERGVSAVFFGLALSLLVGALGLSVDVGNVAYERTKAQHAADAAARHLALQCARGSASCTDLAARAQAVSDENFDGGAVESVTPVLPDVTVTVGKTVPTPLLSFIGVGSKQVAGTATASVANEFPTEGYPVLPFGVAQCTFDQFKPAAGSPDGARTLIRADVLQTVRNLLSQTTSALAPIISSLKALLFPVNDLVKDITDSEAECGTGELLSLQGGIWLSEAIDISLSAATCDVNTEIGVLLYASSTLHDVLTSKCAAKLGSEIQRGSTILLPVYKPKPVLTNVTGALGLAVSLCGEGVSGTCVKVPPSLGVEIVGYAPFKVTGWRFGGNVDVDPMAPACTNLPITLRLDTLLLRIGKSLPLVGNVVTYLLGLLGFDVVEASVGCNGLQGYFTKSFTKDPRFQYAADGADLGANLVRLTR